MPKTVDVFTPNKTPTHTSFKRAALWDELELAAEEGGAIVSVLGTTKLGKSTLLKRIAERAVFACYIPGQQLVEGLDSLWPKLASDLEIPSSSSVGKSVANRAKWGVFARIKGGFPGASLETGVDYSREQESGLTSSDIYNVDTSQAVLDSFSALVEAVQQADEDSENLPPMVIIDDFHFVSAGEKRREIILAMRPLADAGVTIILATLPGREADEGFRGTNVGGRRRVINVPIWEREELEQIAILGFEALQVGRTEFVERLIDESFGSPQIMQNLCLNLCRDVNGIRRTGVDSRMLREPEDVAGFFKRIRDEEAVGWAATFGGGLVQRRKRRTVVVPVLPSGGTREVDGYQLFMWALHRLGAPREVRFTEVRDQIDELLHGTGANASQFALEQKAKNVSDLAARDMRTALALSSLPDSPDVELEDFVLPADVVASADLIPQPVLEVTGDRATDMTIRILDPLLCYALKWHPDDFLGPVVSTD